MSIESVILSISYYIVGGFFTTEPPGKPRYIDRKEQNKRIQESTLGKLTFTLWRKRLAFTSESVCDRIQKEFPSLDHNNNNQKKIIHWFIYQYLWALTYQALETQMKYRISTLVDLTVFSRREDRSNVLQFSSVQLLSRVRLFATPWIAARQASLSITNSWSSPKLMYIESVMPSSHLILCRPLLLLPPIPPSIRVFSNESALSNRWPKYWSFSFSISPSNEHPGLISFRMDWLDLLAVQGTLKSLLQHHSSKASILWRSAFFTVQLSHPYMTTEKTIALTRRTFVGKVMSLAFQYAM